MGASDFSSLPHIGESVKRKEDKPMPYLCARRTRMPTF
jgi:hypothetical protein